MSARMAPSLTMDATTSREQRNEDVRRRIEAVIGQPLRQEGRDYLLPDNRHAIICYSRFHPRNAYFYLGLPSRLQDNDILVLLLGDKHLVFPRAEALLRYKESYPRSGDGRPIPGLYVKDGKFVLRIAPRDLTIILDDRIDAYGDIIHSTGRLQIESTGLGRPFRKADEETEPLPATPGFPDPDKTGRGVRSHARTLNALAAHLESNGIRPLEADSNGPPFDLAWIVEGVLYVAEIKSLTKENEEHQLRYGLGQLLRYCDVLFRHAERVVPVLVPEREPSDPNWDRLSKSYGIRLTWPPQFKGLSPETEKIWVTGSAAASTGQPSAAAVGEPSSAPAGPASADPAHA